ncbi:glycosyltransferase family 4 protein [Lentibacter algarum]|uniref:glycosyltransferase family 4 protein n=1 Tax=Lentibacter algarum TaxID=576131 RepID=UPI001C072D73|nr:glycosyltransferase family 4 protein [Lentibacter algarum]MBU2981387.1 glycosyltransferase family 4 protein [Lentibacter algarum]
MRQLPFYAPLKSPDHPTPSGDRQIARSLLTILSDSDRGVQATLASSLRSYEKHGQATAQAKLRKQAEAEVARLVPLGRENGWPLWVTYHNYYKAPDLIGPAVSRALGIPYVLIEASRAPKRLVGPWAAFEQAAQTASDHAALHFYFTEHDAEQLLAARTQGQQLVHLRPFLPRQSLPPAKPAAPSNKLVTMAMMRPANKLASYLRLSETLPLIKAPDWTLTIIGTGTEEAAVKQAFAPFGSKITYKSMLPPDQIEHELSRHALFLWPGIDEAFGMSYIEAQAQGLAVVAEHRSGVREVVEPSGLTPPDSPQLYADKITELMLNPDKLVAAQQAARDKVVAHHLLPAARRTIWAALDTLLDTQP